MTPRRTSSPSKSARPRPRPAAGAGFCPAWAGSRPSRNGQRFSCQGGRCPISGAHAFSAHSPNARVWSAAIAQLVEHVIRNDGVTGSSPVCGTSFPVMSPIACCGCAMSPPPTAGSGIEPTRPRSLDPTGPNLSTRRHFFLPDLAYDFFFGFFFGKVRSLNDGHLIGCSTSFPLSFVS